ncbi:DNA-binding protein [Flavipsychrobacter stenotrophus]|uniref:DNA-binding protein n=1 Tax=Flavipsychrobacter stenotrophus TaxID=2077091 RepID=A0A2S7T0W2_9BACT|nr:NAD(P)-binding domain-containing protein [Flavipsychrobacter stenotrophus]PQJ12830.1 DNA-binding protein [Flavipsychrobacter stenotrophus]
MKKIGIIGSGQVARVLGYGFLNHNCEVMLGTRDADKLKNWKEEAGEHGYVGSFEDAAKFGDIVVLAVKGKVAAEVLEAAGPQNMQQKTVIDTTNPIADAPPENGVLKYFTTMDESLMERLQTQFPEIHFVKAFNSVGSAFMVDPKFTEKPSMFICGNNMGAKKEVTDLLDEFGWETLDMGKDTSARAIEPLCMLWCIPGLQKGEWTHAFKLMKM